MQMKDNTLIEALERGSAIMGERNDHTLAGSVEIGRYSDEADHDVTLVIDRRSPEAPTGHGSSNGDGNGVYGRVKACLLAHEFPSGKRISIKWLADRLSVSATPVREAFVRLAAERLIDEVPKAGYFAKELSESEIIGLYELQAMLLEWSLNARGKSARSRRRLKPAKFISNASSGAVVSPRAAIGVMNDLFVHIASESGNVDMSPIVKNLNDRTHYIRVKDYEEFGDPERRLPKLCEDCCQQNLDGLRKGLHLLFRERILRLSDLLRILKVGSV